MIGKEVFAFLQDLERNNSKAWFDKNRKRYEKDIKGPFRAFCEELIAGIKLRPTAFPGLGAERIASIPDAAKEAVMRINRDLRFTKDKTPYHTYLRAAFVPGGRKSGNAGLYLTIEPDSAGAGGGVYKAPRATPPGLPRLEGVELKPEYRQGVDAAAENGVKKGAAVVAIVSLTPKQFTALPDQITWVLDRFAEVAPLIGALQD